MHFSYLKRIQIHDDLVFLFFRKNIKFNIIHFPNSSIMHIGYSHWYVRPGFIIFILAKNYQTPSHLNIPVLKAVLQVVCWKPPKELHGFCLCHFYCLKPHSFHNSSLKSKSPNQNLSGYQNKCFSRILFLPKRLSAQFQNMLSISKLSYYS